MLGLYTQAVNGDLYLDASPYMYNLEFTTNEHGFWYLSCNLNINKTVAAELYKKRNVLHVYYGDGVNTFFEGRLEDVEYSNEPKITAYGYVRAFSDLQVTDLWSTQRYDHYFTIPRFKRDLRNRPDVFTIDTNDHIYLALNKNTGIGTSSLFTLEAFFIPNKSSRAITNATFKVDAINTSNIAVSYGFQRIVDFDENYVSANPNPNPWVYGLTTSGYHENVSTSFPASSGVAFFLNYSTTSTYIGETGDYAVRYYDIRLGSTPSISGNRLFADEILKYTLSQVRELNPSQISADMSGIQSPGRDIKECIFEDVSGQDVIDFLLDYPDSNGNPYELKIWENQKVLFRPAKQEYRTWYIDAPSFTLVRTLDGTYNQVRGSYTNKLTFRGRLLGWTLLQWTQIVQGIPRIISRTIPRYEQFEMEDKKRTEYYTNQESVAELGIIRQQAVQLNTTTEESSNAKMATVASLQNSKQLKTAIEVPYVLDGSGARHDPRKVRSGDKIVVQNVPAALLEEIDNTFFISETKWNQSSKMMTITPQEPIDQLATLLG